MLAQAQDAAPAAPAIPAEPVPSIQVTGVRDPAILPYKTAYDFLSKVRSASEDHVQLQIRVLSSKSKEPLPGLDISLVGEHTFEKLKISPDGFITVPMSREALVDNAEFVTNQKKGALQVHFFLVPKLPPDNIKYADVVRTIKAAQAARVVIFPWYMRILIPSINGIGLCYADPAQAVTIRDNTETLRAANTEDTGILGRKVYCASFNEKEKNIDQASLIIPAAGWETMFR
ncbi:hypothetical protein HSX11_03620 [Oxalobacteraceae bacterium]|nr:hypothetical protein [Oxalobacteraceae bacterium]